MAISLWSVSSIVVGSPSNRFPSTKMTTLAAGRQIATDARRVQLHAPLREELTEAIRHRRSRLGVENAGVVMRVERREQALVLPPDARGDLGLALILDAVRG